MAVNSPPLCLPMYSLNRCIEASTLSSMQASPPPSSFLDTYNLSTLSLGCSALCMDQWSFLWSSSQVLVLLVSICSFLVLLCREWEWISWTWNHRFHHGLAFWSLIFFSVILSYWMCIPLSGHFRVLLVLLSYRLSIQPFLSFLFGGSAIFYFKIVRFILPPVVGMFSCLSSQFLIVFLSLFWNSTIFLLWLVYSGLFLQVVLLFFTVFPFRFCSKVFQRLSLVLSFWPVFGDVFICVSSRISHPGFDYFFVLFEGFPIFSQRNFALP